MKAKPSRRAGEVVLEVDRRDEALLASAGSEPFHLKTILVPVDFSNRSKKALSYALALAEQYGAAIALLYVVPTPSYVGGEYGLVDYATIENEMRVTGERELAALAEEELGDAVESKTFVRNGSPGIEIVEAAKKLSADMIVISTHGRTGIKHVLLGSVAEFVVRQASCPVLIVREDERDFVQK